MSMIEVERKRELADADALRVLLADAGFREGEPTVEIDVYYSRPDVDFLATVECLRVRQRDGFAEVTYKPPSNTDTHSASGVIAKRETNVVLAGPEQAVTATALLRMLGMVELCRVEKIRTSFTHPEHAGVTVAIDVIAGVGAFVEVEVMATDPRAAAALLGQVERQLRLTECPVVDLPYRDLVLLG